MKIFKGWFFYLVIAVVMVSLATFASNYHSLFGAEKSEETNLLTKVPSFDFNLGQKKEEIIKKTEISSSTGQNLVNSASAAAQKIASEAPEKLQVAGGVKAIIFRYLSEKKPIFEKNGFYFTEGVDQKWDFGFQGSKNKVKIFSLKP